jgi:transposase-like protein
MERVRGAKRSENFPGGLAGFVSRYATEKACIRVLRRAKYPQGFRCPRCGHDRAWALDCRPLNECTRCGRQVSLTAGTVFHGTRRPLRLWFLAMFLFVSSKQGISAVELSRQLGVSIPTAWTWLHKLRGALGKRTRTLLEGLVETDETMVGGVDIGRPGRGGPKKTLVGGAVEIPPSDRGFGRTRLWVLANHRSETFGEGIDRSIAPSATVLSDGLRSYRAVGEREHHRFVQGRRLELGHRYLPGVHRVFSLLHRLLDGTYQGAASPKHLDAYLQEFEFRFNRRSARSRGLLFDRLLTLTAAFQAPPYWRIVGRLGPKIPLAPAA